MTLHTTGTALGSVGLVVGAALLARIVALALPSESVGERPRQYAKVQWLLALGALGGAGLLALLFPPTAVVPGLPAGGTRSGALVDGLFLGVLGIVAVAATSTGAAPLRAAFREAYPAASDVGSAWVDRVAFAATVLALAVVAALVRAGQFPGGRFWAAPAALVVLLTYLHAVGRPADWTSLRTPTAEESALVEDATDRIGWRPDRTLVFQPRGDGAPALATSSGGGALWIRDDVLADRSAAEVAAPLAFLAHSARWRPTVLWARRVVGLLALSGLAWAVLRRPDAWPGLGLTAVAVLLAEVLAAVRRRLRDRTDRRVADAVGLEAVATGYRGLGDEVDLGGRSVESRLARLEGDGQAAVAARLQRRVSALRAVAALALLGVALGGSGLASGALDRLPVAAAELPVDPVWLLAGAPLAWLAYSYVDQPLAPVAWTDAREADEDDRRRLVEAGERASAVLGRRIVVFEGRADDGPTLAVSPLAGTVWIERTALAGAAGDELAAAASFLLRSSRWRTATTWVIRALGALAALGILWAVLDRSSLVPAALLVVTAVALVEVVAALRRRLAYRTDDAVARDLGADAVRSGYRTFEESVDAVEASLEDRIVRLDPEAAGPSLVDDLHRRLRNRRAAAAVALLAVGAVLALEFVPVAPFWFLPTALAIWVAYGHVAQPLAPMDWERVRDAEPAEVERVHGAFERLGRPPARIVVAEGDSIESDADRSGEDEPVVAVTDVGGERWLWLREGLLDVVSDDQLAAAIGQADELARRNHYRLGAHARRIGVLVIIGPLGAVLSPGAGLLALVGLLLPLPLVVGLVVAAWLLRRRVYAADDAVAERLGADVLTRAYATLDGALETDLENEFAGAARPLTLLLSPEPDVQRRIDRLGQSDDASDESSASLHAEE